MCKYHNLNIQKWTIKCCENFVNLGPKWDAFLTLIYLTPFLALKFFKTKKNPKNAKFAKKNCVKNMSVKNTKKILC